jgi:hypothetical protein
VYQQATTKLLLGAVIIALFADPMVDAVAAFAVATDISPFMVSFVVTPFASNASELVTSLTFASRKRKKNISLTYSQVRCSDGVLTAAHPHQHHPRFCHWRRRPRGCVDVRVQGVPWARTLRPAPSDSPNTDRVRAARRCTAR